MIALYIAVASALVISFYFDRAKTLSAVKIGVKRFISILPELIIMTIIISVVLFFVPESLIVRYLGTRNILISGTLAAVLGSITLMPGFIAYPLCGMLLQKGVSYLVLGIFSSALMIVGVVTFPLEQRYFGVKVALLRNFIALLIALIVGLFIGLFYGEITL